jgi:hypothetical protein
MSFEQAFPAAPRGLKASGKALWKAVSGPFELEPHELSILREVCRTADAIDALQAVVDVQGVLNESSQGTRVHPALVELRAQRLAYTKLIGALELPAPDVESVGPYGVRAVR